MNNKAKILKVNSFCAQFRQIKNYFFIILMNIFFLFAALVSVLLEKHIFFYFFCKCQSHWDKTIYDYEFFQCKLDKVRLWFPNYKDKLQIFIKSSKCFYFTKQKEFKSSNAISHKWHNKHKIQVAIFFIYLYRY